MESMTVKRALFRIRYRTRFIVAEPDVDSHIVDLQIVESRWQNRQREVKRLLARASQPHRKLQTRLADIGRAAQLIDAFYVTEMPVLLGETASHEPLASPLSQQITTECTALLARTSALFLDELTPALAKMGTPVRPVGDLGDEQARWLQDYFQRQIFPLLTPQAVDASHPFPHLDNAQINLLVELERPMLARRKVSSLFASVMMPQNGPRLIAVPATDNAPCALVWREDVVRHFVDLLFPGVDVLNAQPFRVLRAELSADPAAAVHPATWLVTRLDVEQDIPVAILDWLTRYLLEPNAAVTDSLIIHNRPPLGLADLVMIVDYLPRRPNWWLRKLARAWDLFFGHI